ncbi:uncharacterized protein [Labrus bergylta]|uniref:uncharacterized protein isoform X3 n=1 Tax=Labrus bergylta TaxID=56723 RepID=UPI0033135708
MKTNKKLSSARSSSEIYGHDDAKMEVSTESSKRKEPFSPAKNPPATKKKDTGSEEDVQQLLVCKDELPPEQQEWSHILDQEDTKPQHIKEEHEELWISQEEEQLQGLDTTKFPFTPVSVKSEDDEEKPQSSQLHQRQTEQMETGVDGEDCGGAEPERDSDPERRSQPETEVETEDSYEPETEDSDDWQETGEHLLELNLKNKKLETGS